MLFKKNREREIRRVCGEAERLRRETLSELFVGDLELSQPVITAVMMNVDRCRRAILGTARRMLK